MRLDKAAKIERPTFGVLAIAHKMQYTASSKQMQARS
jgi:hypothetical protein